MCVKVRIIIETRKFSNFFHFHLCFNFVCLKDFCIFETF